MIQVKWERCLVWKLQIPANVERHTNAGLLRRFLRGQGNFLEKALKNKKCFDS